MICQHIKKKCFKSLKIGLKRIILLRILGILILSFSNFAEQGNLILIKSLLCSLITCNIVKTMTSIRLLITSSLKRRMLLHLIIQDYIAERINFADLFILKKLVFWNQIRFGKMLMKKIFGKLSFSLMKFYRNFTSWPVVLWSNNKFSILSPLLIWVDFLWVCSIKKLPV